MANVCARCRAPLPPSTNLCPSCGFVNPVAAKKGMSLVAIILLAFLGLIVVLGSIFVVLGIYGTRKYIANAKTAEARNALGQIAKDAVAAYEGSEPHRLCPSASTPVPAAMTAVTGKKYQSQGAEWQVDEPRNAGFACLRFEMDAPQYFQYSYTATATGFEAVAHGDLNGNGKASTFKITGQVANGQLVIAPTILETDPEE